MPVETLRPSNTGLKGAQLRLFYKGPEYFRCKTDSSRGFSAVERLEADKLKYVKSQQVALTRQAPIIRKALLPPALLYPAPGRLNSVRCQRHTGSQSDSSSPSSGPTPSGSSSVENQLRTNNDSSTSCSHAHLQLTNISSAPVGSLKDDYKPTDHKPEFLCRAQTCSQTRPQAQTCPQTHPQTRPQTQTRLQTRPPPAPLRPPALPYSHIPVTVRRVDIRPHEDVWVRSPRRRLWQQQAPPTASQTTPLSTGLSSPPVNLSQSSMFFGSILAPPLSPAFTRMAPPLSPAFTHVSSCSSKGSRRKRPALHRSKSDLSDRFSRAAADLERFFNYCGLDPDELAAMGGANCDITTRANSDIISKLHSASSNSSEEELMKDRGAGSAKGEEPSMDRVPYQISVIERNARVIKWLYGLHQATGGAV